MRPIDADALKREIVDFKVKLCPENRDYGVGYFSALSVVEGMLACSPTLTLDDLRPKGRWVNENGRCGCSECRQGIRSTFEGLEMWLDMSTLPFCPFCGADMRGCGEEGE